MLDWHSTFFIMNSCFVAEFMSWTLKLMQIGHVRRRNVFVMNGLVPERNRLYVVVRQFMMFVVLFHMLHHVLMIKLVLFKGKV